MTWLTNISHTMHWYKVAGGNILIMVGMSGSATVAGMSWLDQLDAHAAAYGIITASCIGMLGVFVQLWKASNERKHQKVIEADLRSKT